MHNKNTNYVWKYCKGVSGCSLLHSRGGHHIMMKYFISSKYNFLFAVMRGEMYCMGMGFSVLDGYLSGRFL